MLDRVIYLLPFCVIQFLFFGVQQAALCQQNLPDMVVTKLTWTPAVPMQGQKIFPAATIKNIGNSPTPQGTITGVSFAIGPANPLIWSDTYSKSIVPGESVTLRPNGGANGATFIIAPGGDVLAGIYAWVNDSHRYKESNFENNRYAMPIHMTQSPDEKQNRKGLPDLVVTDFKMVPYGGGSPAKLKMGDRVEFIYTIHNRGAAATPEGQTIGVDLYAFYTHSIAYSDRYTQSLKAGQSVMLRSNGGMHAYPVPLYGGRYRLQAYVNDLGNIKESNVANNSLVKWFDIRQDPSPIDTSKLNLLKGTVFSKGTPVEAPWTSPECAFDGLADTSCWLAEMQDVYIGIDLGDGNSRPLSAVRLYPRFYYEDRMDGAVIQGSNTGPDSGFVDLCTLGGDDNPIVTGWNSRAINSKASYRWYRYFPAPGSQCMIGELQFYSPRN
jgi:hypothetical protein